MSTELNETPQVQNMYLGMNEGQFGMLMSLTSLSRQMQSLSEGQDMQDLMTRLIAEDSEKSQEEVLAWVRNQRNHILNILHAVLVSQNLLVQIDDALFAQIVQKGEEVAQTETETV